MVSTGLRIGSVVLCIAAFPAIAGCASSKADSNKSVMSRTPGGTRYRAVSSYRTSPSHHNANRMRSAQAASLKAQEASHRDNQSHNNKLSHNNRSHSSTRANRPANSASRSPRVMQVSVSEAMPPQARAGECYAAVYVPPEFDTVSDRVMIRDASEKIEIVPAKFEWVEERVMVKEASTKLVEIPAEFAVRNQTVQTSPDHVTWVKAEQAQCTDNQPGNAVQEIFCLVSEPSATKTLPMQRLSKGARVKEIAVPAEYETIRKQKLVRRASKRTVHVPAEYQNVERTVMTAPGRMEWQRIECDQVTIKDQNKQVRPVSDWNP